MKLPVAHARASAKETEQTTHTSVLFLFSDRVQWDKLRHVRDTAAISVAVSSVAKQRN